MAFPPSHLRNDMADDHPGTPTDELYRLPVCSGLSSPPTNYFAPPIQYSPVEHPPRSGCCSSIPFPTRADPRLPPSYVLFDKKASSFGAERGFPPRTLADDRIWETLELEGAGTNSHLPYPVTPRAPPPDTNGWKWLAPHHFPYADSRPVVDRPPWTQHTLSQFSYTAAVDLVHPSQENDPAILVDDCRFNGGETSVVEEPPKAESLVEGQPCDLSHPVDKSPSGETDPEVHTPTSPTSVEHLFRRIENGLCECTWRNDSEHPCGFTSRRIVYIKQHIKRVHLQLRPFLCAFCGHGFFTRYACLNHQNTHTGLKPHLCEECGTGFPSPSARGYHRTRAHGTVCTLIPIRDVHGENRGL